MGGLYKHLFAWLMAVVDSRYEKLVHDRKSRLFSDLSGSIVEIGPGTGPNLKFLNGEVEWTGFEPNEYMHPYIRREAKRLKNNKIEIRSGSAERLPLDDNTVDAVISTLVLCTVKDQDAALYEIRRVLRPGGKFVFLEHVAAPRGTRKRRLQEFVKPIWKVVADGCHPDRETLAAIERAGFKEIKSEQFELTSTFVSPHIAGVALKG